MLEMWGKGKVEGGGENGRRRVADGKWQMGSDKWKILGGGVSIFSRFLNFSFLISGEILFGWNYKQRPLSLAGIS